MAIQDVRGALVGLRAVLERIVTPGHLVRVYDNPAEAVSLGDFPCAILGLAPQVNHTWGRKALQLGVHKYTINVWLFVGSRQNSLPRLHERILGWPQAVADVILADQTLGGAVAYTGDGGATGELFRYQVGEIVWADGAYFGLQFYLPVAQTRAQVFG